MSEVPDGSFVIKPTFMNEYSGILLSTFIYVSTILRFLYIQYMICFYKCTAWKKDLSCNKYSIKHNQHGPATFQLKTQGEQD